MNYIGKGIYTISDIVRITGISASKIRRWSLGYKYTRNNLTYNIDPLFQHDFEQIDNKNSFSFLDMVEILFISTFEDSNISLQSVRKAAEAGSKLLNSSHPFAKKVFYTDGKTILARIAEENHDPDLIDLLKKQYQIDPIVLPTLYESLDFDHYDYASKFWPLGKSKKIVVDPSTNFGKPTVTFYNIPTDTILEMYKTGHSFKSISEWFEIDEISLKMAIEFEMRNVA